MARRCPDCDVALERVDYSTSTQDYGIEHKLRIKDPEADGVLARIGIGDQRNVDAYLCPECRLVRLYA